MSEVAVVRDAGEVAQATGELFLEAAAGAAAARDRALVALTGGSTAAPLYAQLRAGRLRERIPWPALHFFFGDERAVPESDPLSNAGLAARELFTHVPVAPSQVHRLRGDAPDLDAEARRAATELSQVAGTPPRFDLVLLGLGPDGHILSLFAGAEGCDDRGDRRLVRHVTAPERVEPRVPRLTLSPFLVVTARMVVLQVTGAAKADAFERALKGKEDLRACPAHWLRHAAGRVVMVADEAAARRL